MEKIYYNSKRSVFAILPFVAILLFFGYHHFVSKKYVLTIGKSEIIGTILMGLGAFAALVFLFVAIKILAEKKRAIVVLNSEGIHIHYSANKPFPVILWSEVESSSVSEMLVNKFVLVMLKNPDTYLARVDNKWTKTTMEMTRKQMGTPIRILTTTMEVSAVKLSADINEYLKNSI